ncbi:unnamed protein product [Caenorhabditis auriculariae]|uniref:Paired domain-containing protein n=1 Tax=Caenorhabditis auriculariae TaxID=2777116 RepID=A0A8S1H6W6_9PELO|nr:unnamed protein product [Caenorhabditis auriculariae]
MVAPSPHRTAIIDCLKKGMSNSEIIKSLKIDRTLVYRTAKRFERLGTSDDVRRSGRPVSVTTSKTVKEVRKMIEKKPEGSMRKMAKDLEINLNSKQLQEKWEEINDF